MSANPSVHMRAEMYQLRDGKPVFRGDPFIASPEEAADLVALRLASIVEAQGLEVEEELPPSKPKKPILRRKVPTYQRRDLRAEGEEE